MQERVGERRRRACRYWPALRNWTSSWPPDGGVLLVRTRARQLDVLRLLKAALAATRGRKMGGSKKRAKHSTQRGHQLRLSYLRYLRIHPSL